MEVATEQGIWALADTNLKPAGRFSLSRVLKSEPHFTSEANYA